MLSTPVRRLYYGVRVAVAVIVLALAAWHALVAEIGVGAIANIAVALAGLVLLGVLLVGRRRRLATPHAKAR